MPDRMKPQDVFFEIEEWEGDGTCLTAAMLRNEVKRFGRTARVPAFHTPVVHPDAWKALQEMDEEMEKASGATDFNIDEFVTE
jgi:hypothetical protein